MLKFLNLTKLKKNFFTRKKRIKPSPPQKPREKFADKQTFLKNHFKKNYGSVN